MRACIFGAGAIGGYIAAMLAQHREGAEISVVARGAHLEAIRAQGLLLRHKDGRPDIRARFAHAVAASHALPPQDVVIVTLKATALEAAAADVARLLAPGGVAVYVNNGIPWWWEGGAPPDSPLAREVGVARVLGCVAILSNFVEAPGVVRTDGANEWYLGEPTGALSDRLRAVVSFLQGGGLHAQACTDLRDRIWRKLQINVPNHALGCLTRLTTDEIYARPELVEIAARLVDEVRAVAQAHGCTLAPMSRDEVLQRLSPRTRGARPSMLQDVIARRPLEVEAVFGRVLALAQAQSVDTPALRICLGLLRGLDRALALERSHQLAP